MDNSASQNTTDSISKIYDLNKISPLFVRAAGIEIKNSNADKAIKILEKGLKVYAEHPVALILLSKAYAMLGNFEKAFEELNKSNKILKNPGTFKYYRDEIENLKKGSITERSLREDKYLQRQQPQIKNADRIPADNKTKTESNTDPARDVEDRLDQLAETISSAKIQRVKEEEDPELSNLFNLSERNMIISETLADIYLAQGEYKEALKVYDRLIERSPEKKDYYTTKIKAIKARFES